MTAETGWLLERLVGNSPVWFDGTSQNHWTCDSIKAVRFARKQDAETIRDMLGMNTGLWVATEHEWCDRPSDEEIQKENLAFKRYLRNRRLGA